MIWSLRWQCMIAASLFLTIIFCGQASSQHSEAYNNAVRMHGQYKHNQEQINALNKSIADHQGAIRSLNRDMESVSYGYGSPLVTMEFGPQIAAHREAIARDRETLALLQRRQTIIERSWNNNFKNYYGSLRETSNRTIYDPKTRQNVNLMDFRVDSFRNPGGKPAPHGVRSQSGSRSSTGGRVGKAPHNKTAQAPGKGKSSPKTTKSSSGKKSSSTGGGTHSISLTPVD